MLLLQKEPSDYRIFGLESSHREVAYVSNVTLVVVK